MTLKTILLGDLKDRLDWMKNLPDDTEIYFGGGDLTFIRAKTRLLRDDNRTPARVQIVFAEEYEITAAPGGA